MKKIKEYSDLSKAEKQQALDAMINLFLAKILDGEFGYDEDDFEESGLDDVQRIVVTQVLEAQEKAEKLSTPFYFIEYVKSNAQLWVTIKEIAEKTIQEVIFPSPEQLVLPLVTNAEQEVKGKQKILN